MSIYLDYQATTPPDPAVIAAMEPYWTEHWGNPHSEHRHGWNANAAIAAARKRVAAVVGVPADWVVFTSGATEANNLALKGIAPRNGRRRIVTLETEHSCVLETARYLEGEGAALSLIGVDQDGLVDLEAFRAALGDDVAIVSVMAVNNEIGVIQPLAELAALTHAVGALFHCDAAQAYGKLPLDMDAIGIDLMSVSAHKIYGPKGVGALIVREGVALAPQIHGGGQEARGLRSGTLPTPLIVGFGKAAEIAGERMDEDRAHAEMLWELMLASLDVPFEINGSIESRWKGNLNSRFPGVDGARLIADLRGLSVSAGAACASATGKHSHVLEAIGLDRREAGSSLRIGWGRFTTTEEIRSAAAMINAAVGAQLRDAA
jgi:cysteine desulfurase